VRDVEATKKFWAELGGTPIKIDGTDVIKFPGVLIFLTPGTPAGGTRGSTINHIGLGSENVQKLFAKLEADGVKFDKASLRKSPLNGQYLGDVNTPDGVMIEVTEEAGVAPYPKLPPGVPIESNHMHMFVAKEVRKDMQAWYVKMFGGEPWEMRGEYIVSLPGVKFLRIVPCGSEYSACPETGSAPTKGRALDHVGFEVKNLRVFCKNLEAQGVKFTQPYSKSRHKSFASVEFTDPWGTSVELTEGLNRF
jgi:catechol 2,3-dioxygenase-like lactoylglutathione lyase family enzyme